MYKFYNIDQIDEILQKQDPIQVLGCPYYIEINEKIKEYLVDSFVWNSPFNIVIFTESLEFMASVMNSLQLHLKQLNIEYEYDKKNYILKDSNSKIKIKLFQKDDEINAAPKFYDLCLIHFCEEKTENVFDKICQISKKIVFLTQDDEKSIYYSLDDESVFYRLYSEESNKKIEEFQKSEVVDEKARKLVEGKFNNN